MIDHLELRTRRLDESLRFYSDVLKPLGYAPRLLGATNGFGDGSGLDLFIAEGEPTAHVHFAFAALSRVAVDAVYEAGRVGGHRLDRAPALAPSIHPNYYAGYLRDPDGHLVEFVCQRAE